MTFKDLSNERQDRHFQIVSNKLFSCHYKKNVSKFHLSWVYLNFIHGVLKESVLNNLTTLSISNIEQQQSNRCQNYGREASKGQIPYQGGSPNA